MTVFTSAQGDMNKALTTLSQNVFTVTSVTTDDATLTTAQFINGIYVQGGTPGTTTKTTPTAADIVAAIENPVVDMVFDFIVNNNGDNTLTLAGGSGVTVDGTATVATTVARIFKCYLTNVSSGTEAVTVVGC